MADLQQILGTMLATGMGGRSGRNADHIGSVLGRPGIMGMSAGGGPDFKQTAGLAALGYLAYRAFQERQQNQARAQETQPSQTTTPATGGSPWGSV